MAESCFLAVNVAHRKIYCSVAFVPAGNYNYNNGALNNVGERQLYWSGTANTSATNAWNLNFNSSTVYPGTNNNNKGNGFSVRCVAR